MALFSNGKKKARSRRKRKETKTEALLRQRGSETVGFALLLVGLVFAVCFATYSPDDPSFFVQTDAEASNLLGMFGSYLADTVHLVLGASFWTIPLILIFWGGRLMLHRGAERAIARLLFAPIAILLVALFFSTHESNAVTGMGGILGDESLSFILGLIPLDLSMSLKTLSVILAVLSLVAMLFVLGVDRAEARFIWQYLLAGFVMLYIGVRALISKVSSVGFRGARVGAVAAGRGLNHAGESGLRAAKVASERIKEQRETAHEAKDEKIAERLTHLHDRMSEEIQDEPTPDYQIVPAYPAEEIVDTEVLDPDTEYPSLGGVSRELPAEQPIEYVAEHLPPPVKEPKVKYPDSRPKPKSRQAKAEEQPKLAFETQPYEGYQAPPLSLLSNPIAINREHLSDDALTENAKLLETVLDDYGIRGEIIGVRPGPVVTMYELEPAAGVKASRVIGLADDIARSMSALAARVSTVPGRSIIGIELPNEHREMVLLREIFSAKAFGDSKHQLPMALGKDIGGDPVIVNLARMPHLLIAGTTGSGKSVGINTMILSLVYALSPEDCRLIMIDPKMLELSVYDGIPHLLSPVVTDPKKAVVALKWAVAEMEERYRKMSKLNVRNIDGFNGRVADALKKGEAFSRTVQTGFDDATGEPVFETEEYELEKMPYIVIVVDEMADLMMVAGKEIEACIQRLAQMARAAGIHLIMATQRPSVDVITGTIKANFPTRISFQVTSKIDSRTVLGEMGAEQLLGKGDMLYMSSGGRMTRVHGPFVSDEEVEEIVGFLKSQGAPEYLSGITSGPKGDEAAEIDMVLGLGSTESTQNALLDQAIAIIARDRKCSISYIQRKLSIGYNKAAKLVEEMEDMGVVSPANHVGKREVLVPERPED